MLHVWMTERWACEDVSARLGGEGGRQFYDTWVTLARKARKPGEMRLRMLWRRRPQKPASDARYTIHTTLPEYQASSIRPAFFTTDMIDWRFPGYDRRLQLYMFLDLQHLCIPPNIPPRHCSRASGSFRVNSNQKKVMGQIALITTQGVRSTTQSITLTCTHPC